MEIAKAVGDPIKIDRATLLKTNGQYARVLVEVNYNHPITTDVLIKRLDFSFWVQVCYEGLLDLCDRCQAFEHKVDSCRRKKDQAVEFPPDGPIRKVHIVPFRVRGNKKKGRDITDTQSQIHRQVETINTNLVPQDVEAIHQTHGVRDYKVAEGGSQDLSGVEEPTVQVVVPVEVPASAVCFSGPAKTYAEVVSVNRFAVLSEETNDVISERPYSGLPSPQEIRDKVLQNSLRLETPKYVNDEVLRKQLQIERDLQLLATATSSGYCSEHDLEGFVHVKSRSLKKLKNKAKSLKKKLVLSTGKQKHSYALRGNIH